MATLAQRIADLATAVGARIKALETSEAANRRLAAGALGYSGAGVGGTITQATSKATAVTFNKLVGDITMNAAALAAGAIVTFTLNNSLLLAGDQLSVNHQSGGTVGPYLITARVTGAGVATITVRNTSAGSLSEAIVLRFLTLRSTNA